MRIFVDEMPNCCGNCGFCCKDDLGYWCQAERLVYIADELYDKKRLQSCLLKLLADHTKQVQKKVCEQITEELLDVSHQYWKTFLKNGVQYMTSDDLYEFLEEINNKIQGEKYDK